MERFFTLLGFRVSEEGILTTTTLFARAIANSAVRDGSLIKTDTNTFLIK
jgi:hypothetical protein